MLEVEVPVPAPAEPGGGDRRLILWDGPCAAGAPGAICVVGVGNEVDLFNWDEDEEEDTTEDEALLDEAALD